MFFFDEDGVQRSLPRAWTDVADVDPFVVLAAGRIPFRFEDLVALAGLIDVFWSEHGGACHGNYAVDVNVDYAAVGTAMVGLKRSGGARSRAI